MNKEEYQSLIKYLATKAMLINEMPVRELLDAISWCDTVGPILDPILYRKNQIAMHQDEELLLAALKLADHGAKLKKDAEASTLQRDER